VTTHRAIDLVDRVSRTPFADAAVIGIAVVFVGLILVAPLGLIVVEAFRGGVGPFIDAVSAPETRNAIRLSLAASVLAIPPTVVFGIAAAWTIVKCEFPGRTLLLTLIDLPFSLSPVVAGMLIVLLLGRHGALAPAVERLGLDVLYTPWAIVIALMLVILPFVAREVIPLMQAQGREEEEVALSLGAGGFKTLLLVTLPNIKWALLHGVLLAWARAMGDFGAVSVVSGRIQGSTMTVPLHIESLHGEYRFTEAFAVSTVLIALAAGVALLKHAVARGISGVRPDARRGGTRHVH
jgi:sulfate/thiosulfate transport system permease protein